MGDHTVDTLWGQFKPSPRLHPSLKLWVTRRVASSPFTLYFHYYSYVESGPSSGTLWADRAAGPGTVFFLSGQSYTEAIWENSSSGNAYYILAQAWIAARLNVMSGAFIPADVETAWNDAMSLFEVHTPAAIDLLSVGELLCQDFLSLAGILEGYNNGLTGPGHCD